MILWAIMAVLAAVASLSILGPLYRGRRAAVPESAAELSVYKDQLGEVERDLARGLISDSEAGAAKIEISRRLIKADETGRTEATAPRGHSRRAAATIAVVAMPLLALGVYLALGSPNLPDQPLSARLSGPIESEDVAALVARVEAHLTAAPDDGKGWEVIAPIYLRSGRYQDAVRAYANTIGLLGDTSTRESDLGDAIVRLNDGIITAEARIAFEAANKLDPAAPKPRFYLAVALGQEGRKDEAIAAWRGLLEGAPADAPWVPAAKSALARLEGNAPTPSADDVTAADKMAPEERLAMINGMVGQLAAKLAAEPDDADGWARLIRSYMVLGRKDDASAALSKARAALNGKAERLAIVEAEARSSGLIE